MPAKQTRHSALTETLAASIDSQVAKGEYASTSNLICTAIQVLRTKGEDEGKVILQLSSPMQPQRSRRQT